MDTSNFNPRPNRIESGLPRALAMLALETLVTKVSNAKMLTHPTVLHSRSDVLGKPCPVPQASGVYAWFFNSIPPNVPTDGCVTKDQKTLLYVGISPDKVGKPNS